MRERAIFSDDNGLPSTLRRKIDLARAATGFERLWPHVALIGVVAALFVALSWFGLFTAAPRAVRIALGLLFIAAFGLALWRLAQWRLPDAADGARRLDLTNPALHRPVSVLNDRAAGTDPVAFVLWQRHRERAEAAAAALKVPAPANPVPARDPYALRALAVLLLVSAGFVAGDERTNRLADAFSWGEPRVAPTPPRLDAWIDPPVYTGRAPIFLSGAAATSGVVSAPAGSVVTIRVFPSDAVVVTASPTLKVKAPEPAPDSAQSAAQNTKSAQNAKTVFEQRLTVEGDGTFEVKRGGVSMGAFDLRSIPDVAPSADLASVEPDEKGQTLRMKYRLEDDYGIAKAEAIVSRADRPGARTLVPPPEIGVSGRIGDNESVIAPQEHAWAGVKVSIRIRATDDIGQFGESIAREAVLPVRRFENPVSRALVEQRRQIVMFPDDRRRIQIALGGLMVAPERFTPKSGDYLMLSIAARKLRDARNDADLIAFADYLWETAVALDEGNITDADRALRAAEERLREALERGAPPEEIKKLMEELRQAMNEFLREFADRAERNQDGRENERDRNERTLTQRDLNDILKQIEELYKQGDTAKAQELLRQMQEMMRNLQTAKRQNRDPRMKEMGEALDELEKMMRDQENLRDETFRDNQKRRMGQAPRQQRPQQGQRGQRGERQQGQQGQQGDQTDGDEDSGDEGDGDQEGQGLTDKQQALRDRLKQLREKLRKQGAGDQEGMEGADEGMGDAEQNLRQKQGGRATQGQQKAIDELGKAGKGLSQQMQREMGDGTEPGDGQDGFGPGNPNGDPRGRADSNTDPLGRPMTGRKDQMDNSRVKIPESGNVQGSVGERAQRVLEELRRRFGETARPQEELDYIERLLRRN